MSNYYTSTLIIVYLSRWTRVGYTTLGNNWHPGFRPCAPENPVPRGLDYQSPAGVQSDVAMHCLTSGSGLSS